MEAELKVDEKQLVTSGIGILKCFLLSSNPVKFHVQVEVNVEFLLAVS